jgi:polyisoprenyl-teichoic acid--peptidoglycan teichoic acid transferase
VSAPEGERPGGEEPFEGIPEEDLGGAGEPELEPEFVEALRAAERADTDEHDAAEPDPEHESPEDAAADADPADDEPAFGGSAAQPAAEEPTAEQPLPEADEGDPPNAEGETATAGEDGPAEPEEADPSAEAQHPEATVEFTPQEVDEAQQEAPAPPADAQKAPAPAPEGQQAPVSTEAQQATAPPPPTAATGVGLPRRPPPEGDAEPAPKRKRIWLRFLLGSLLIVASMATATAASALIFLDDFANKLAHGGKLHRSIADKLAEVHGGDPETILILGSDKRASLPGTAGLSDTTILLRLDPDNNAIALMSIPRDLKTYIPGVGTTKFNAAYAYGGPKLTLRVVKRLTGLAINHVVNVDFLGFQRAVNAIDCVYVDVDRRYYHSNAGLPASLQYSEINIQPGYQKLCGKDALAYARYRHTDTDLVRAARQQDFLREARQQVPASDLFFSKRDELLDIFTKYTTSDISSGATALDVLKLFVASRDAPIKEVHFPAVLHPSFVTASRPAIDAAVQKFLGIEASGGPRGSLDLPSSSGQTGIGPEERKRAKEAKQAKQKQKAPPTPSPSSDGLVEAAQFSHSLAAKVAHKTYSSFPVFYPRRLPSGSIYVQVPRVYHTTDGSKNSHQAYKMVLQLPQGDYFGIQGLQGWPDPPILTHPNETRTIGGREYQIYLDGDRVRLIAWHQGDNTYWVSNSLLQTLSNDQMLGVARAIDWVPGEVKRHKHRKRAKA